MDSREKAIENLQSMIREQRARLDPEVLRMAQAAAQAAQPGAPLVPASFPPEKLPPAPKKAAPPWEKAAAERPTASGLPAVDGSLPYDRKAAAKAVEIFLSRHDDPRGFQQKLLTLLQKNSH